MSLADEYLNSFKMYEMTNELQRDTGLTRAIWVSVKMASHSPRIKIRKDTSVRFDYDDADMFSMTISDNPSFPDGHNLKGKEVTLFTKFVLLNKQALLDLWEAKISYRDFQKLMKKVS